MKTNKNIKSCPFCGSSGAVYIWGMSIYWSATCTEDKLKGGETCGCGWNNYFKTKEAAVEKWNKRTRKQTVEEKF